MTTTAHTLGSHEDIEILVRLAGRKCGAGEAKSGPSARAIHFDCDDRNIRPRLRVWRDYVGRTGSLMPIRTRSLFAQLAREPSELANSSMTATVTESLETSDSDESTSQLLLEPRRSN
jgi:hypothetical protein